MATYVIGDLQGCFEPFQALLQRIRFKSDADRLLLVGDLVNRGGQSLEVLRLLYRKRENVKVVLGNHDISLLAYAEPDTRSTRENREFEAICNAPDAPKLLKWLRTRPLVHRDERHNVLMVHAGVCPAWNLKTAQSIADDIHQRLKQGVGIRKLFGNHPSVWQAGLKGKDRLRCGLNYLTRMRFVDDSLRLTFKHHGPPGTQPDHLKPWFQHEALTAWTTRIVFGHWSALGLYLDRRFVGLDTGCVWGGALTALRLDDERVFQVPGLRRS